ncbi:MAG: PQQ-binding-like beta-propeller repeat protein [Verrucomicrobia bacterium]|nr:PQQ-binding-like beta-propeller repeat protein [Verrucomicrobiota bacterium]
MTDKPEQTQTRYACARIVATIASLFCATLTVLMLSTFFASRSAAPLDTPELQAFKQQIQAEPENESFKTQVRALDLLARQAHFTSLTALQTGAVLLLIGLVVMVTALQIMRSHTAQISHPAAGGPLAPALIPARYAVIITSLILLALAALIVLREAAPPPQETPETTQPAVVHEKALPHEPPAWPAFRGHGGLGVAENTSPPLAWDGETGSNTLWKQEVPRPGFSSPIVCQNRVFLTGGDSDVREVYCFSAEDGALLWRHPATGIAGAPETAPEVTSDTGYAAATMATDGMRVYAIFASGNILAMTLEGDRIWAHNHGVPENPYGHASSLLVHEDLLLVQFDDDNTGRVLALRTDTGAIAWRVDREVLPCWSTPILVSRSDGPELIVNGNTIAAGYNPRTGAERWRHDCMGGEVAVSPAWWNGTAFVANQYAKLAAIRLNDDGTAHEIWEGYDDLPDVSSPVAWSNQLFMADSYGVVSCWDTETGELHWRHEFDEGFYASPIVAAGRIYVTDKHGKTRILAAANTFTELGTALLGESSTSTPAFVGERVFIRGAKHLFCIGIP